VRLRNPKSEAPKSEGNPKSEGRNPKAEIAELSAIGSALGTEATGLPCHAATALNEGPDADFGLRFVLPELHPKWVQFRWTLSVGSSKIAASKALLSAFFASLRLNVPSANCPAKAKSLRFSSHAASGAGD
jgi:hypothetical protein